MKYLLRLLAGLSALLLLGCTSDKALPLTETYVIPGFGFSIDYPGEWFVDTNESITWIVQTEGDFNKRYFDKPDVEGVFIALDHRTIDWLALYLGFQDENPTLNELFQLNIEEISGMQNPEISETKVFGVDALKSEFYEERHWHISYAGYLEDEAFLVIVTAPTQEALEEFKPTWEKMLESIKPVDQ